MLKLTALDKLIGVFWPAAAVRRGLARRVLAEYEGGKPTRLRKAMSESRAPNQIVGASAARLRNWARHQERNLDIARGALNTLVRNIVGPDGISVEPMPKRLDGSTHDEFADALMALFEDWARRPEVTWRYDWAGCQRMLARTWLRDGEALAQAVEGLSLRLDHGTRVPLSLELLEPDLVPLDYDDPGRGIRQGVELNDWNRPRAYWVYKYHPGDNQFADARAFPDLKRVDAERVLHLALRDRLHQIRGVSIFASVINRLEDIKDYEDSERVAARIAAALTATIKRDAQSGDGDSAVTLAVKSEQGREPLKIEPGMVFDEAGPGDEINVIDTKRPSAQVEPFRMGQLRAAASGLSTSFSSLAKNYDGTYSAQRQELVEQWPEYQCLTREFISMAVRPVWERFVPLAILSGAVRMPADLDPSTMTHAEYIGPPMPWIDPLREIEANRLRVRVGESSLTSLIRSRGGKPWQTFQQLADERKVFEELGIVLDADPAKTSIAGVTQARPPDSDFPGDEPSASARQTPSSKSRSRGSRGINRP